LIERTFKPVARFHNCTVTGMDIWKRCRPPFPPLANRGTAGPVSSAKVLLFCFSSILLPTFPSLLRFH